MTQTLERPPADPVALAQEAVDDAEQAESELIERVRAGDDEITPEELAAAQRYAVFTRLRLDAARRRVAADERAAAQAQRAEARAVIDALLDDDQVADRDAMRRRYDAAVGALAALSEAVETRNAGIREARGQAVRAGLTDSTDGSGPVSTDSLVARTRSGESAVLKPADPSEVLAGALLAAIGGRVHRGARPWVDLDKHANRVNWSGLIGPEVTK